MFPRPIIQPLPGQVEEILPLDLVKEFIGLDPDIDAEQDAVLPVLIRAAIEEGEQVTGIVWGAANYEISGLHAWNCGLTYLLPLCPVFDVKVFGEDNIEIPDSGYIFTPAAIELGRPWAEISGLDEPKLRVECVAGWTKDTLPEGLRAWALQRIAALHDYREDTVVGSPVNAMPRYHARGLLDRWTVRSHPYA